MSKPKKSAQDVSAKPKSLKETRSLERVLAPHNLPYQMRLLVQLLTRRFQTVIEPFGLTPLHWGVLSCLWQEDGLATQTIAARLEQLGGTVTVVLDAMEKRGLIRRTQDPEDRRVSRIWLSRKGKAMRNKVVPLVTAFTGQVFSSLTADECSELARMVERLRDHVEQMPSRNPNSS
jgi:DNA-binding MarR family transcriptional regulator